MSANLEWVGHACFRLWRTQGPVLVTDPFTPSEIGLPDVPINGDVVIASSLSDPAHSNVASVRGARATINALDVANDGTFTFDGAPIVSVPTSESALHPEGPKDNAMYAFQVGGLWFLHMGDAGEALGPDLLAPFAGHCDVLLALVGGGLTIALDDLDNVIEFLRPNWIVPMHYALPGMSIELLPVDAFLAHRSRDPVLLAKASTVSFPLESFSLDAPVIVVLEASAVHEVENSEHQK